MITDNIFKTHKFIDIDMQKDELYKTQMQGLADKTLSQFTPLTNGAALKGEFKHIGFQKEFIDSYLEAAKVVAKEAQHKSGPTPGIQMFYNYSLSLPILYLSRHCMELSIKRAIERVNGKSKNGHNLERQWDSFLSYLPKDKTADDKTTLSKMQDFVKLINKLDETGTKFRYAEDNNGYTQNDFYWINNEKIVEMVDSFVQQLESLKDDNIK